LIGSLAESGFPEVLALPTELRFQKMETSQALLEMSELLLAGETGTLVAVGKVARIRDFGIMGPTLADGLEVED
jgi:hypothetical protein